MDKIKIIHEAHKKGLHDGQINFWMGILSEVLEDINGMQRVFEYGALNSKFLEFLEIVYSIKEGKGILMEVDTASKNFYSKISQTISLEAENTIVPNHAFPARRARDGNRPARLGLAHPRRPCSRG